MTDSKAATQTTAGAMAGSWAARGAMTKGKSQITTRKKASASAASTRRRQARRMPRASVDLKQALLRPGSAGSPSAKSAVSMDRVTMNRNGS